MTTDRTTKVLLALIAVGLFLNAIVPFVQPAVVQAQSRWGKREGRRPGEAGRA